MSQSSGSLASISRRPMTYQTQAIQWARSAKTDMSRVSTTALHCEYRSSFCSSLSKRSSRTVFSRCTSDVCRSVAEKTVRGTPPQRPPAPMFLSSTLSSDTLEPAEAAPEKKHPSCPEKVSRKCRWKTIILKLIMANSKFSLCARHWAKYL